MGLKTKAILSCVSSLVIFPRQCSLYQTEKLLKDHVGMSKQQVLDCLKIDSRWILIHKACPQYVMHEHGVYLLGREIY